MGEYCREQRNLLNQTADFCESKNSQLKGFVDNRAIVIMQAKMINEIGVIQGYWAVPIRESDGSWMTLDNFRQHQSDANTYYNRAIDRRNQLNQEDKEKGEWLPLNVACHGTTFGICGRGRHGNGRHAEIQILDDCPDQDCFEIGITQDMCTGTYGVPSCQNAVTTGYNAKKAIFAQVPNHLYIFPKDNTSRTEVSESSKEEICDNCKSRPVTAYDLCQDCLNQEFEEAQRRDEEERMEEELRIIHELEEDERQEMLKRRMEEFSEIPTYEHICKKCGLDYESYNDSESDFGCCNDCMRAESGY